MASTGHLAAAKSRVSAAVLKLPGVAGVGVPDRGVTVYLEDDSSELRGRVAEAIGKLELQVPIFFEVSGKYRRFEK